MNGHGMGGVMHVALMRANRGKVVTMKRGAWLLAALRGTRKVPVAISSCQGHSWSPCVRTLPLRTQGKAVTMKGGGMAPCCYTSA
eukprot:902012-Pelagomonas_calceolata.AAC.5